MPRLRIAIGYEANIGKTIAGRYITSKYGGRQIEFSDAAFDLSCDIKRLLKTDTLNCNRLSKVLFKVIPLVSTPNIWFSKVDELITQIDNISTSINIIISDVKTMEEYKYVKEKGFITVKIVKDNIKSSDDISELDEQKFDYTIDNNGSGTDLRIKLDTVVSDIETKNAMNIQSSPNKQ